MGRLKLLLERPYLSRELSGAVGVSLQLCTLALGFCQVLGEFMNLLLQVRNPFAPRAKGVTGTVICLVGREPLPRLDQCRLRDVLLLVKLIALHESCLKTPFLVDLFLL